MTSRESLIERQNCNFSGSVARVYTRKSKDSCVDKTEIYVYWKSWIIKTKSFVKNKVCNVDSDVFVYENYDSLPKEWDKINLILHYNKREKIITSLLDNKTQNTQTWELCSIDYSSTKHIPNQAGPNWFFIWSWMILLSIFIRFAISRLLRVVK